jgi:hypothetical protein
VGGVGVAPGGAVGPAACLDKFAKRAGGRLGLQHTSKHDLTGLWSNSDSELNQEINAKNGTSNSYLQKNGSKKFALKLDSFLMNPQKGIGNPFAPLTRGPDGLVLDAH